MEAEDESALGDIESLLNHIGAKVARVRAAKKVEYDECAQDIVRYVSEHLSSGSLALLVNAQRDQLLSELESITSAPTVPALPSFTASKWNVYDAEKLLGHVRHRHPFHLVQKLTYPHLFGGGGDEHLGELDMSSLITESTIDSRFNTRVLMLAERKLFVYTTMTTTPVDEEEASEPMSSFRVYNRHKELVAQRSLGANLIYKNLVAWHLTVVSLFYDSMAAASDTGGRFVLSVFDASDDDDYPNDDGNELRLRAERRLAHGVHLTSVTHDEVICWNQAEKRCLVYSHRLDLLAAYGQETSVSEPFYFANGNLIDASPHVILYYYFDESEQNHYLKVFERSSGRKVGRIDFDFSYFSKMIKIDALSNILIKLEPNNVIKYYDARGSLLGEFADARFEKFSRIDLTSDDRLTCYDKALNRLFYL